MIYFSLSTLLNIIDHRIYIINHTYCIVMWLLQFNAITMFPFTSTKLGTQTVNWSQYEIYSYATHFWKLSWMINKHLSMFQSFPNFAVVETALITNILVSSMLIFSHHIYISICSSITQIVRRFSNLLKMYKYK